VSSVHFFNAVTRSFTVSSREFRRTWTQQIQPDQTAY